MIWWLEGLGLMRRNLSRSLLLIMCWTLALLVAGLLGWAMENSLQLREALMGRVPAEVYVKPGDGAAAARVLDEVSRCRTLRLAGLLGTEAAAAEFRQGFGVDVVELLGENPFPVTVLLKVKASASPREVDGDMARLRRVPGVEGVHLDRALLGSLGTRLRQAGRAGLGVGLLLALLTVALLAAAVRSLARAWEGEARLLTLQGARTIHVVLPPAVALLLPALLSLGLAHAGHVALDSLLRGAGLPQASMLPVMFGGGLLPLLLALVLLKTRMKNMAQPLA